MQVQVWSDVVCPWCYIGKRRLETAIDAWSVRSGQPVEVVYRSFELDSSAPRTTTQSLEQLLSQKYGVPVSQARAMQANVTQVASEVGLTFDLDRARPANTLDAHRLLQVAGRHGLRNALKERFMKAYFCEGAAVGDPATLQALADEVGLDPTITAATLADPNAELSAVRADQAEARRIGVRGVPFFVLGGKLAVSGAQPVELLQRALTQAAAA